MREDGWSWLEAKAKGPHLGTKFPSAQTFWPGIQKHLENLNLNLVFKQR